MTDNIIPFRGKGSKGGDGNLRSHYEVSGYLGYWFVEQVFGYFRNDRALVRVVGGPCLTKEEAEQRIESILHPEPVNVIRWPQKFTDAEFALLQAAAGETEEQYQARLDVGAIIYGAKLATENPTDPDDGGSAA